MGFEHFLRSKPDACAPGISGTFIIIFIIALFLIARYVKAPKLYAVLGISLQIMILAWYIKSGILLKDGLPLYHCRISLWVISIGILLQIRSKFIVWMSMLGIPSSLLVLIMRDMDPFMFPHITNLYYFLGHGVIFLISISYIDFYYERLNVREIAAYALGLHIFIYFIDVFLRANYAYLIELPIIKTEMFNRFSFFIVTLLVISIVTTMKTILETTAMADMLKLNSRINRRCKVNKRRKLRKTSRNL